MTYPGWFCIGTFEGNPLYFNSNETKYAVEQDSGRLRDLTKVELKLARRGKASKPRATVPSP
jgi:hypothetical protein